ncbi:hypothetical protein B0H10DRAFT_2441680 [Mycena sp. CBHHK59/15]|nr:hypothetical protein B0H10DRAFT_2441680 [Mycena sp. CBHHK59/15]
MGVSNEQYGTLKAASERFLNEKNFSFPHIDAALTEIFGVDHSSKEARAWKDHFKALEIAEEKMKAGDAYHLLPVPLIDSSVVDVDVEMIPATQTLLSNDVLNNSEAADRERKRTERKKNGNVHGKEKKGAGHSFDDLMASVFIERKSPNKDGVPAPIYHCIGCDTDFRNNTKKRNATHMLGCKALQRDFPATWKRFKDDLDPSVEHVASGEADLPPLQGKKRKVEDDAEGCVPIPGITTALSSHSQSQGESSGKRLGIKLFSVVPSEMCDEQTASKLTAMNTAKHNNLGPENLLHCAQLNQYWRYGFGSSEVQRHCQKVWLELPTPNCKSSDPIVAGIPTLQDLLNADTVDQHPIDEEAIFNHPVPYGIKDFEVMEEGEDDTDTAPPPLVIRRANLPTLEIETYIDPNSTKLAQPFAPDQGKPQQLFPAAPTKPVKDSSTKWMVEDAEWDAGAS